MRLLRRPSAVSATLLTAGLLATACASGDADTDTDAPGDASPSEPADTDPSSDAEPEPSDATEPSAPPPATDTPVTTLAPDESADLPTARPDDAATVTTLPGPLRMPSVQLIEEAVYDQPIDISVRPGDGRMIIIERGGRVIAADAESSIPLADMSDISAAAGVSFTADGGEQGLLGAAFHPDQPFAYLHFSAGNGDTVVAEFAIDPISAEFDPASYRELLRVPQPFPNHNGGELEFGPDGLLYLGLGDGGSANDPERASLDLSSPLGSLLRFDPTPTADSPVTIPADNPYATGAGPAGEPADPLIWSSGLRNPWKFSFDELTGDLWIADVGQGEFEEINRALATNSGLDAGRGLDFGWSAFEAYEPFNDDQSSPNHIPPVAAYVHDNGDCSVSGGVVARNSSYVDLNGWYVYGDFCSGRLWALDTTTVPDDPNLDQQPTIIEIGNVPALTSVAVGADGDIYAVSIGGQVYRLAPA